MLVALHTLDFFLVPSGYFCGVMCSLLPILDGLAAAVAYVMGILCAAVLGVRSLNCMAFVVVLCGVLFIACGVL